MRLLSKFQFLLASKRENHSKYKGCGSHTNVETAILALCKISVNVLLNISYRFSLNGNVSEEFREEAGVATFPSPNVFVESTGIISLEHNKSPSRLR